LKFIEELIDIIYPPRCIVCGEIAVKRHGDKAFCDDCRKAIPWIDEIDRCPYCSAPSANGNVCGLCATKKKDYIKAISVFEYNDVKTTVENYKFDGHKYLADSIGRVMYDYAKEFYPELFEKCDMIVPLPIHSSRRKERGFDQSALIAKVISEKSGLKYDECLVRIKATSPQSLIKGYTKRAENVKGVFKAIKALPCNTVLLIDDVITTGSSANECTKALMEAGAEGVYVLTFAASFKNSHELYDTKDSYDNA